MTQTVTNDYGGIALDNVSSFKYGHLTLIWNLKLGFGVFYPEKSKGSESKKGDF